MGTYYVNVLSLISNGCFSINGKSYDYVQSKADFQQYLVINMICHFSVKNQVNNCNSPITRCYDSLFTIRFKFSTWRSRKNYYNQKLFENLYIIITMQCVQLHLKVFCRQRRASSEGHLHRLFSTKKRNHIGFDIGFQNS